MTRNPSEWAKVARRVAQQERTIAAMLREVEGSEPMPPELIVTLAERAETMATLLDSLASEISDVEPPSPVLVWTHRVEYDGTNGNDYSAEFDDLTKAMFYAKSASEAHKTIANLTTSTDGVPYRRIVYENGVRTRTIELYKDPE